MSAHLSALVLGLCWLTHAVGAQVEVRKDLHGDPLPPGAISRLGTNLLCAAADIGALAFSPDGKLLLSRSKDEVQAWDVSTGKLLRHRRQPFHTGDVLAFSTDGKWFATSGTLFPAVCLWSTEEMSPWAFPLGKETPTCMQFAPQGSALAVGTGRGQLYIADATTGAGLSAVGKLSAGVTCLAWLPDGKTLVAADQDGTVWFWDPAAKKEIGKLVAGASVTGLAATADGKWLAVITAKAVEWVDVASRKTQRVLAHNLDAVAAFQLAPDGSQLALAQTGSPMKFRVLAPARDEQPAPGPMPAPAAGCCAFADDCKTLALARGGRIELIAWPTGKPRLVFRGHGQRVDHVAFLPGDRVLTVSGDGDGRVWEAASGQGGESLFADQGFDVAGANRCLAGTLLFARDRDRMLCQTDVLSGNVRRHELPSEVLELRDVTPDGNLVLLRTWDEWLLWDLKTGSRRLGLGRLALTGKALVSPDGKWLVTEEKDELRLWDVAAGKVRWKLAVKAESPQVLAFVPDGKLAVQHALQDPNFQVEVVFHDVATGKEIGRLPPMRKKLFGLTVSSSGGWFAVWTRGGEVAVWEAATEIVLWGFSAYSGQERRDADYFLSPAFGAVEFSPDSRRLAVGLADSAVLVFDWTALPDLAAAKALTPAERESCWKVLADNDGPKVLAAMALLSKSGRETVEFFKGQLTPVPGMTDERLQQLLADLDANEFAKRDAAMTSLAKAIEVAEPALRKLLEKPVTLEQRRRAEKLLESLDRQYQQFPSARLRSERAVQVLEWIGTAGARELLQELSGGDARARLTRVARAALAHLENQTR
jgi:WD40 repeat protein